MAPFVTRFIIIGSFFVANASVAFTQIVAPASQPLPATTATSLAAKANLTTVPQPTDENNAVLVRTSPVLLPPSRSKSPVVVQNGAPGVPVGITYYDFQTNASMSERLGYYEESGEKYVQLLWMAATDSTRVNRQPGFNDSRGSYYSFIDVTNADNPVVTIDDWKKLEAPNERAGWPSLIQFSDGRVSTPSHNNIRQGLASGNVVKFFQNGSPGDDVFFEISQVTTVADTALWPRAAVDGANNVHLIYNRSFSDGSSQLCYRRSTDEGNSWENEILFTGAAGLLPAGVTGTLPNGAGGDTYAITARGPVVVVAYADGPLRILTRKSTDYGRTWDDPQVGLRLLIDPNHTPIDSMEYTVGGVDSIIVWTDTVVAPSAQIAIAIDSAGIAHYAVGQTLTYIIQEGLKDNSSAGSRRGTIYSVSEDALLQNLGIYYYREGDSLIYTVGLAGGGSWDGKGTIVSRRAYTGASRYPQLGIDKNDNLYMVYTSVKSGDAMSMQIDTTGANANEPDTLISVDGLFGHLYVTHKPANTMVWSQPKDITPEGVNCLFGTLCDDVRDRMYIAYSANSMPGDRVTSVELPLVETTVYLYAFPTANLNTLSSVQEQGELGADVVVYPNPATDAASVSVRSVTQGRIAVSVVTMQGENMMQMTSPTSNGVWDVTIPTGQLASGSYLLVIEQNGTTSTRTLNVLR